MSGYPNADYGGLPEYPSEVGTSCGNPKPAWYWEGGSFCNDVTIGGNLSVMGTVSTSKLVVSQTEFAPVLFLNPYDGLFYQVLASAPYPSDFVPPPVKK